MNFNFDLDDTIDEDFFGSLEGKSSKLQQLFMDDVLSSEEQQQTLKYQRPKANDFKTKDFSEETSATNVLSSITLMAKVVHAFRQGESLGKVGLALVQNPNETYAIIMYKTKANILTNLKLESSNLYKQQKYWQFYGDRNLYWSFSFGTALDEEEFVKKLKSKNITYKEAHENQTSSEMESKEATNIRTAQIVDNKEEEEIEFVGQLEAISFTKENKNSLIKRMAKMGKPLPTLPTTTKTNTGTDFSDSSDTEVINTPRSLNQKPAIVPRVNKLSGSIKNNQQLVASTVALNPTPVSSSVIYPINPLESQYMQMVLSEQRTQGSELRMNMNKLENKIEKVLDKLDLYGDCRHDGKQKAEKDDEILELEEKVLILKKENRKLRQTLEEKSKQNILKDYLKDLQEDLKEFNIESENDLKESVNKVIEQLRANVKDKQLLEEKLEESERNKQELQKDSIINNMKIKDLEQQVHNLKTNEEMLKTNLNVKDEEMKQQQDVILNLQKDLREKHEDSINNAKTENLVKSIMNSLYVDIQDKLEKSKLPQQEQILTLIATTIRKQTLESLKRLTVKEN